MACAEAADKELVDVKLDECGVPLNEANYEADSLKKTHNLHSHYAAACVAHHHACMNYLAWMAKYIQPHEWENAAYKENLAKKMGIHGKNGVHRPDPKMDPMHAHWYGATTESKDAWDHYKKNWTKMELNE